MRRWFRQTRVRISPWHFSVFNAWTNLMSICTSLWISKLFINKFGLQRCCIKVFVRTSSRLILSLWLYSTFHNRVLDMIAKDYKVSCLPKSKGVLDLSSTWETLLLPAARADGKIFLIHFFTFFFFLIDLAGLPETKGQNFCWELCLWHLWSSIWPLMFRIWTTHAAWILIQILTWVCSRHKHSGLVGTAFCLFPGPDLADP